MLSHVLALAIAAFILARLFLPFLSTFRSPFRSIPGPLVTRFSRLWYLRQVYNGDFHHTNIALHKKYGPTVRIAPDLYSIATPDKAAYGIKSQFPKSDWYEGWKHPSPDRWTLFTDQSIKRHHETRRRYQNLYSMSSLVSYEQYVDDCTGVFALRLKEFAANGQVIDMAHWLQCYAFDVIGSITYSSRFGFLDAGHDIEGTLAALHQAMIYASCVGVYAWLHPILYPLLEKWSPKSGAAGRSFIMKSVQRLMDTRKREREKNGSIANQQAGGQDLEDGKVAPEDFLDKMLNAHDQDPEKVTDYHVYMMGLSNIIAGSDTTAVSLSSVLYHLLRYPATLKKLREEISAYDKQGRLAETTINFAVSQEMPYLQACIKEGLRLHAAVGLPLWRVVPEGGAEVQGQYFPAGTTVGINTWVAHFDESVFGSDAKEFRPERWIEAEKGNGEKSKMMEAYWMPFGLGSRTCLGKHISILEMSKLLPQIVRQFDFELEQPDREWKTKDYWFVKPTDFRVQVKVL